MDWDAVRVFLAVARHGQILGAARGLGLNHATVARRIATLEASLGGRLFVRTAGGVLLSSEGEVFLPHAEAMESAALRATEVLGERETVTGTVRVGTPDGFGSGFVAPRIGELLERHPDLAVELVPVPRSFSLSRREADIAVTLERPREGRLVARKLTDYTLGLYASRSYVDRHGLPRSADELSKHRLVGYVSDLLFSRSLDYATEFWKPWQTTIGISSAIGQTAAVRGGAGIGVLHRYLARETDGLIPILEDHTLQRSYWAVVHEDLREVRRVRVVGDFISGLVKREAGSFR